MSTNWRKTKEYRKWRISVIRRDKRCMICGSMDRRQAHHISSGSYDVENRFNTEMGVCLCYSCHMNFHCNFKKSYREKCTNKDWDNFNSLCEYIRVRLK